jgi:hypothetical protein
VSGECGSISQNNQLHAGTCNGYVHSPKVVEETDFSLFVGTYQTDKDDITLLTLKTVYGVDGYKLFIRRKERAFP